MACFERGHGAQAMQQVLEFASNHPLLIGAALLLLAMIVFTELRRTGGNQLSVTEAVKLMNQGGIVLDVRSADAFRAGHILGARNTPLDELREKTAKLDKETPLILCCDAGNSSQRALAALAGQGFTQLFNLRGGLRAWQQDNLPLSKKK